MDGWVINYKSIKQGTWTGTSSHLNDNGDIKVYYNNSTSQLILRSDKALPEDTRISLYDILGKCIQKSKLYLDKENTYSINVSKLPKGIYSVFIEKGNSFIHNDVLYLH